MIVYLWWRSSRGWRLYVKSAKMTRLIKQNFDFLNTRHLLHKAENDRSFIMGHTHRPGSLVLMLVVPSFQRWSLCSEQTRKTVDYGLQNLYTTSTWLGICTFDGLLVTEEISKLKENALSLLLLEREFFVYQLDFVAGESKTCAFKFHRTGFIMI